MNGFRDIFEKVHFWTILGKNFHICGIFGKNCHICVILDKICHFAQFFSRPPAIRGESTISILPFFYRRHQVQIRWNWDRIKKLIFLRPVTKKRFFRSYKLQINSEACVVFSYSINFLIKTSYIKIMVLSAFCQKRNFVDQFPMCEKGTKTINILMS